MAKRNMVCIVCPLGCRLDVEAGEGIHVTGNGCKRGIEYAVKECTNPTRSLTTTIAVDHGEIPVVPVKTAGEVPKVRIMECMKVIGRIRVEAPVRAGDILLRDLLGMGVDVIACRTIDRRL